jgi:hypothetical protein
LAIGSNTTVQEHVKRTASCQRPFVRKSSSLETVALNTKGPSVSSVNAQQILKNPIRSVIDLTVEDEVGPISPNERSSRAGDKYKAVYFGDDEEIIPLIQPEKRGRKRRASNEHIERGGKIAKYVAEDYAPQNEFEHRSLQNNIIRSTSNCIGSYYIRSNAKGFEIGNTEVKTIERVFNDGNINDQLVEFWNARWKTNFETGELIETLHRMRAYDENIASSGENVLLEQKMDKTPDQMLTEFRLKAGKNSRNKTFLDFMIETVNEYRLWGMRSRTFDALIPENKAMIRRYRTLEGLWRFDALNEELHRELSSLKVEIPKILEEAGVRANIEVSAPETSTREMAANKLRRLQKQNASKVKKSRQEQSQITARRSVVKDSRVRAVPEADMIPQATNKQVQAQDAVVGQDMEDTEVMFVEAWDQASLELIQDQVQNEESSALDWPEEPENITQETLGAIFSENWQNPDHRSPSPLVFVDDKGKKVEVESLEKDSQEVTEEMFIDLFTNASADGSAPIEQPQEEIVEDLASDESQIQEFNDLLDCYEDFEKQNTLAAENSEQDQVCQEIVDYASSDEESIEE